MAISISAVLFLLILAVIFLKNGLKMSHAVVCALFGFFLAGTSLGPTLHNGLTATADIVGSLHP
ncbi:MULTISPECIES: hypothetical protein [Streptomyces]|uniref:DUF2304 domain-containing protein n=1 Tax=Streptomyces doudnae TaxID=3075536 RepID=A0ABD5EQ63_9ACTN|nr:MULTISPECIES: hypothetical protein [unclassified Streptomyces]MDT0435532.1 hypothetical protein [Streptomyces sp. DSM 41981]MYQ64296.1 hypothetical protein [Streptomyces sp. SID4950]SCD76058.1 hypothetical protein GA0115242_113811 [Streptomyces sp. SolWspMP-5a-2]